MSLLKPPVPQIATRKFFVRIEEPLAQSMERYAEFLGTDNLDHVVSQALQFIFKRDTQFKTWVVEHPQATTTKPSRAHSEPKQSKPKSAAAEGGPQ